MTKQKTTHHNAVKEEKTNSNSDFLRRNKVSVTGLLWQNT